MHCIELPANPFTFRAWHQAAMAQLEQKTDKSYKKAEEILLQSLSLAAGTGDLEAEEQAKFTLANVYYFKREFDKAAYQYEQAVKRFKSSSRALPAREQLGDCYRQLADKARRSA